MLYASLAFGTEPWKLNLRSNEAQLNIKLDLYSESINVPGMDMFGPMNGYLSGKGVYGTWMVTSFKIKNNKKATIRFSNDFGSEAQEIVLTQETDSTYIMEIPERVVIKKVVGKKLAPIPNKISLKVQ